MLWDFLATLVRLGAVAGGWLDARAKRRRRIQQAWITSRTEGRHA